MAAPRHIRVHYRLGRNRVLEILSVGSVLLVVMVLLVVKASGGGSSTQPTQPSPPAGTPVAPSLLEKIDSVPLGILASAPNDGLVTSPQAIQDPPLRVSGKPDLLYIGAEFCPVCATERWAMYVALSKFGTFSPAPGQIHSAVRDGDISTLTFYKTDFTSPYLDFTPVETTTDEPRGNYYAPLQSPSATQQSLWQSHTAETFPWLDLGGSSELTSAQFSPGVLEGQSFKSIASQIGNNSTTVGADIDASAYALIQSICTNLTGDEPAGVCRR